jgi:two-component system alkaline phosphatase synthesis response regulator PhoP
VKIYCVEDENSIRELIVYTLNTVGFTAVGFSNAAEFFEAINDGLPNLVLLDIMMSGEDGLSVLKKLRSSPETRNLPIIMITAKTSEYDKVTGLDLGADDYITKPFGMMELVARINALLRRSTMSEGSEIIEIGNVLLDSSRHKVMANGSEIDLALREFQLLELMMQNPGIVFTRDRLLVTLWGYDFDGETRTVDVHVRRLREKLGSASEIIKTVRGVGYKIEDIK